MKLAELLLQRVQLQNDLSDQAERIQENAQVLEGEQPLEDPELILKGLLLLHQLRLVHTPAYCAPQQLPRLFVLPSNSRSCYCCRVLDHYRGVRDDADTDPRHQRQVVV